MDDARSPQQVGVAEQKSMAELAEIARTFLAICVPPNQSIKAPQLREDNRLQELDGYRILDSGKDEAFERITKTACRLFGTPLAHIGIMDDQRLWYKATCGPYPNETPRRDSVCSTQFTPELVEARSVVCFSDMRRAMENASDSRPFKRACELGLRFYASAPLISPNGMKLGTLCIGDQKPRDALSEEEEDSLMTLAGLVMDLMEARKLASHFQDVCESKEWQIRMSQGMPTHGIGAASVAADEPAQRSAASSESSRLRAWGEAREQEIQEARLQELQLHTELSQANRTWGDD